MYILVVGSGGRESALTWKLHKEGIANLYIAPGNAGTEELGENVPIDPTDIKQLARFATQNAIDLTIVGPDDALDAGVVDVFNEDGLPVFGPSMSAARIETSKRFAKSLMNRTGVPTAKHAEFEFETDAQAYAAQQKHPLYIKADGLAKGKGAIKSSNVNISKNVIRSLMTEKSLGESGSTIVIEEELTGYEASLHAVCSGTDYALFPSSEDHKTIYDGDHGPNTGGMGVIAPHPLVTSSDAIKYGKRVIEPVLADMANNDMSFSGLLYPGLMIDNGRPNVIEYNARFGDPETQAYMRLMESGLLDLILGSINGNLASANVRWSKNYAVCVAIAAANYPDQPIIGDAIEGIDDANSQDDVIVFQAGTIRKGANIITNGGRVLYVTGTGHSPQTARQAAYSGVDKINFKGMQYRTDIGNRQRA